MSSHLPSVTKLWSSSHEMWLQVSTTLRALHMMLTQGWVNERINIRAQENFLTVTLGPCSSFPIVPALPPPNTGETFILPSVSWWPLCPSILTLLATVISHAQFLPPSSSMEGCRHASMSPALSSRLSHQWVTKKYHAHKPEPGNWGPLPVSTKSVSCLPASPAVASHP